MGRKQSGKTYGLSRRGFLRTVGATAAGVSVGSKVLLGPAALGAKSGSPKGTATVRGAFLYPPTESLRRVGYYSWPGSTFGAEERQKMYMERLGEIERELSIRISMNEKPLDGDRSIAQFIDEVKKEQPDGLLLIPFKKGHWQDDGARIVKEVGIPTIVLATLGVLLMGSVRQLRREPGVYMISSSDNLDAVAEGMKMIKTGHWMRNSRIVNIQGSKTTERTVPVIGTRVRDIPGERFIKEFERTTTTDAVKELADAYANNAKEIVEPSNTDIVDAAKAYFVLKRIIEAEEGDAVMMECLPGLMRPHKHVPPCMGFMSLRDEGIAAGCEADLDATLTLMLLQELLGKPGFQHNPSVDTEKNHYFCAHCTSASRMHGRDTPPEPYILRNHAEAGWGCVPRVLFSKDQEITVAKYLSGEKPDMLLYSGKLLGCPSIPPTGGCRTNAEATINELDDVSDLKGHHLCMAYGNHTKQLKTFCQLYSVKVVT